MEMRHNEWFLLLLSFWLLPSSLHPSEHINSHEMSACFKQIWIGGFIASWQTSEQTNDVPKLQMIRLQLKTNMHTNTYDRSDNILIVNIACTAKDRFIIRPRKEQQLNWGFEAYGINSERIHSFALAQPRQIRCHYENGSGNFSLKIDWSHGTWFTTWLMNASCKSIRTWHLVLKRCFDFQENQTIPMPTEHNLKCFSNETISVFIFFIFRTDY